MIQPFFSICIPNYNYANYIGGTIQSVLDQTCQDFEIIVADNASTDDSISVVEGFQDERIRLVKNRFNIGFAPNLQRASQPARGKYMLMLSSDDRMRPNALEIYQQVLIDLGETAQSSILFAEAVTIDSHGKAIPAPVLQPGYYQDLFNSTHSLPDGRKYLLYAGMEVLKAVTLRLCSAGPFLSMLYPRTMYEVVEGYNSIHMTDPDTYFAHKLLALEPQVAWVREPLFEYRVHAGNQLGIQKQQASIKKQIDKYMFTLEIPDPLLTKLEIERQELIRAFIYRYCVKEGFEYLSHGVYAQALKGLMFGLATYAGVMLRTPRAYGLAILLSTGPLAPPLTRLVRDVFRGLGGRDE